MNKLSEDPSVALFDVEATLVKSYEKEHFIALARASHEILGFPTKPRWIIDNIPGAIGGGDMNTAVRIAHHLKIPDDGVSVQNFILRKKEIFAEMTKGWPITTRPGVIPVIKRFIAQGWHTAIFSNTQEEKAAPTLEMLDIATLIPRGNWVFAGNGIPRKPAPDGLLEVARRLGVEPQEIVFFGDSPLDGQAANAADALFVATPYFTGIPSAMKELRELNPVMIVRRWTTLDLPRLIRLIQARRV